MMPGTELEEQTRRGKSKMVDDRKERNHVV